MNLFTKLRAYINYTLGDCKHITKDLISTTIHVNKLNEDPYSPLHPPKLTGNLNTDVNAWWFFLSKEVLESSRLKGKPRPELARDLTAPFIRWIKSHPDYYSTQSPKKPLSKHEALVVLLNAVTFICDNRTLKYRLEKTQLRLYERDHRCNNSRVLKDMIRNLIFLVEINLDQEEKGNKDVLYCRF